MQNSMVKILEPAAAVDDRTIKGEGGEIDVLSFANSLEEASVLADLVEGWITNENVSPSEIGVLMSKQVEEYAELLTRELQNRRIPFRNEQNLQDISVEPIARVIIDFLLVVRGVREPDAYTRLMDALSATALGEDSVARDRIQRFLDEQRAEQAAEMSFDLSSLPTLITRLLDQIGQDAITSLSSEYEQGDYLAKKIQEIIDRITTLFKTSSDLVDALKRFSEDLAVRIMTIHKSKGLEFDTVVLLGVEEEAFFGKIADERSVFFVGISRAKRRLILTSVGERPMPTNAPRRWSIKRTPQKEFLDYALEAK
jgi:superfamily I DNA/RNA helicase